MKIIDNKKDYYDFLISINGIDEGVVFDRRGSKVVETDFRGNSYFAKVAKYNDSERQLKRVYDYEIHKANKMLVGLVLYFAIEVGTTHYIFQIERYLENGELVLNTIFKEKLTNCKKIGENAVINFIPINYDYGCYKYTNKIRYNTREIIENPILRDTQIPAFISAEEIYDEIYNYIISTKEKEIIDTRNDVQKLESRGFDKKISFRNPIKL